MSVFNPAIFIGEAVPGATAGAPLSTDSNGNLASGLPYIQVSQASTVTTTSATPSVIGALSVTPVVGTYIVFFDGNVGTTSGVNGRATTGMYLSGTLISGTQNTSQINVALLLGLIGTSTYVEGAGNCQSVVTVNGSQTIDMRFSSPDGVTVSCMNASMILLRIL